ncbi:MAG: thioredoxin domain-containing protein [Nocardioides sp.]|nr:thioredoxin domain-containing protein [Nocardioides sp.]
MFESRKSPLFPLLVAAVAAIALVVVLTTQGNEDEDKTSPAASGADSSESSAGPLSGLARRDADDPVALGEVDAPVVMVAYSEYQCPYCGKFARDTEPKLIEKYVEDGTLRIEWRDFPYLGPESTTAALAGRAAAAQDKFWEFHEAMFADQLPPNSGNLNEEYVASVADDAGLDVDQFREDMSSDAVQKLVDADFNEGQSLGVNGTPSFVINGTPVVGAQPLEHFEQVIDEAAEAAP